VFRDDVLLADHSEDRRLTILPWAVDDKHPGSLQSPEGKCERPSGNDHIRELDLPLGQGSGLFAYYPMVDLSIAQGVACEVASDRFLR
jgi:hypothetical protein